MPTASALLLCLLVMPPSPLRLRVDIVLAGLPMPPQLENVAMKEVADIWARYGVDVRLNSDDPARGDAVRLAVVLGNHRGRRVAADVLGSIPFLEDSPAPVIWMYSDAISEIVSTTSLPGCGSCEWSPLHNLVMGRVLGRALAHEIGHYLLRSRQHSPAGLMRAHQPAARLVYPDDRPFRLSADEVVRLESRISTVSRPSSR